MEQLKRLTVVTGHFGSGKTEFSLNLAVKLKNEGKSVTIVDLDIVNPYFRTNDARRRLEDMGIKVIAPLYANTNLDLPALPSDIYSVFDHTCSAVVFDVGGDDEGAAALGRYNAYFLKEGYDMLIVANAKRPLTQSAEEIAAMCRDIESASRLKATGLVNNTHLMQLTTPAEVELGQEVVGAASRLTGIPIRFISGKPEVLSGLGPDLKGKAFELDILYLTMP